MAKWVLELPAEVQEEIRKDATAILIDAGYSGDELKETIECVMNEKLINIIGYSVGELPAEKYARYIWED